MKLSEQDYYYIMGIRHLKTALTAQPVYKKDEIAEELVKKVLDRYLIT